MRRRNAAAAKDGGGGREAWNSTMDLAMEPRYMDQLQPKRGRCRTVHVGGRSAGVVPRVPFLHVPVDDTGVAGPSKRRENNVQPTIPLRDILERAASVPDMLRMTANSPSLTHMAREKGKSHPHTDTGHGRVKVEGENVMGGFVGDRELNADPKRRLKGETRRRRRSFGGRHVEASEKKKKPTGMSGPVKRASARLLQYKYSTILVKGTPGPLRRDSTHVGDFI